MANPYGWKLDSYLSPIEQNEQPRSSNSSSCTTTNEIHKAEKTKIIFADIARNRSKPVSILPQFASGIEQSTFTKFGVTFDEAFVTVESRLDNYHCRPDALSSRAKTSIRHD